MTISELRHTYTPAEICSYPGDPELRFHAFAPLFRSLHHNRVVYRESRFYVIATLSDLELTPRGLSATARLYRKIERSTIGEVIYPEDPWRFACRWGDLRLVGIALNAPYISFTLWPEASLVSEVERLVNAGEHDAAHALLYAPEPPTSSSRQGRAGDLR
jgi:hypothetical protein